MVPSLIVVPILLSPLFHKQHYSCVGTRNHFNMTKPHGPRAQRFRALDPSACGNAEPKG